MSIIGTASISNRYVSKIGSLRYMKGISLSAIMIVICFIGLAKKIVHWSDSVYDNDDCLVDTPFLYGMYMTVDCINTNLYHHLIFN